MLVYFYLYCFGFLNVIISYINKKYDRISFIFFSISLLFFATFRYGISTDYFAYVEIYNESLKNTGRIEIGYIVLNKFLKYLHCPVEVLFALTCLIVLVNYYKAFTILKIHRTMALFVFFCFFYLVNVYNLIRHGIAVSFLILGFSHLIRNKPKKALLNVLAACFFHYISILIGLMIICYRLISKRFKFNLPFVLIITTIMYLAFQFLIVIVFRLPDSNIFFKILKLYFSNKNQNRVGLGTFLNIILLYLFIFFRNRIVKDNKYYQNYLDLFLLYFISLIAFWSIPTITERVTSFFYQSVIILISILISYGLRKKKYLNIFSILSIATLILIKYIFARDASGDFAFLPYEIVLF